jgi:NAD dependent epimerase/dehydratase family enzyme
MEVFAKALGDVLNRPSWVSVPPSALALMLGEMSEMLLHGQRAVPEAALVLTTIEARHPRQSMNALDHDEPDSDQESF